MNQPYHQPKDYGIQILRVAFTIWILFYHSFNEYFLKNPYNIQSHEELEFMRGITNLVLQGFMFISGLLLARGYIKGKYHDTKDFIKQKIFRLLIPYLFWSICLVLFYNTEIYEVICGAKHLWFLLCLFDLMVLSIIILPTITKTNVTFDVIILFGVILLSVILKQINLPYIFGLKSSIAYLPSFIIGIFIVKYHIDTLFVKMNSIKFYSITSIVFSCATIVILSKSLPYGSLYINLPYYITPPILYVLIIKQLRSTSPTVWINSIAANSLGIYILHQFVGKYTLMRYIPGFVEFYDRHYILAPTLLFIFMLFMAWYLSILFHKIKIGRFLLGTK